MTNGVEVLPSIGTLPPDHCLIKCDFHDSMPLNASDIAVNTDIRTCILSVSMKDFLVANIDINSLVKHFCRQLLDKFPKLTDLCIFHTPAASIIKWRSNHYNIHLIPFDWFMCKSDPQKTIGLLPRAQRSSTNGKAIAMFGDSATRPQKLGFVQYADSVGKLDMFDYSMTPYMHNVHVINAPDYASNATVNFTDKFSSATESYLHYAKEFQVDCLHDMEVSTFHTSTLAYPDNINEASMMFTVDTWFGMPYRATTEKTWKPFVCELPFVSMTHNDIQYQYIEDLGFRTFIEYTDTVLPQLPNKPLCSLSLMENVNKYNKDHMKFSFELALTRVENLLGNLHKHRDRIEEDIAYNKTHFLRLRESELEKLQQCPALCELEITYVLNNIL